WISVHAWYHDLARQDEFILGCIRPIVAALEKEAMLRRFFYIRYLSGGPHIRLRVLPEPGAEDDCRALIERELSSYLRDRPSQPEADSLRWGHRGVEPEPDNTWRYVAYDPEVERYGGEAGIELAEAHFEVSTRTAFEVLNRSVGMADPTGAKLAYALQLMSVLVPAAGFRGPLTYRFLEDCLRHVYVDEYEDDDYQSVFRRLRDPLVSCFKHLGTLEVDWALGGDQVLAFWGRSNTELLAALAERLELAPAPWRKPVRALGNAKAKYVRIVHSYLHMFLNRLGFMGRQEERIYRLARDAWQRVALS